MNCQIILKSAYALIALYLTFCGSLAPGAAPENAAPAPGKNYVVMFAVGDFPEESGLDSLNGPLVDMRYIESRWIRPQLELAEKKTTNASKNSVFEIKPFEFKTTFSADLIYRVYNDDDVKSVTPTKENFLTVIDNVCEQATQADVVYVFAATHGVAIGSKSCLCPQDIRGNHKERLKDGESVDEYVERKNLISVSDLIDRLGKCKGKAVLAIDACRTIVAVDASEKETDYLKEIREFVNRTKNVTVVTACSLGQESQEFPNKVVGGVFFYYFSEGLSGKADPLGAYDGRVTLVEAFNYADSHVRDETNNAQTPECYMETEFGDLTTTLVSDSLTSSYDEDANDYYFAICCGDKILRNEQSNLAMDENQIKIDSDGLLRETFDYAISAQPSNTTARYLRGYVRRANADYKGALEDFNKAGFELTLFVTGMGNNYTKGAFAYSSSSSTAKLLTKSQNEALIFANGAKITVDKWENERLHVVSYKMQKCGNWIDAKYVNWTPIQAASTLNRNTTPARSSNGARDNIIDRPTPDPVNDFN